MQEDHSLPVLNSVIKHGNESIIRSTRLGHAVLDELEALKQSDVSNTPEHIDSTRELEESGRADIVLDDTLDDTLKSYADPLPDSASEMDVLRPGIGDGSVVHLEAEIPAEVFSEAATEHEIEHDFCDDAAESTLSAMSAPEHQMALPDEDDIEILIDELVDRHVSALREDLRRLLLRSGVR